MQKWELELNNADISEDVLYNSFRKLYATSTSTKIRSFQFRLLHRIMGNNKKLFKWGIKNNDKCDLCGKQEETYVHLFCECEKIKPFWLI